jgi:hypothetical protein
VRLRRSCVEVQDRPADALDERDEQLLARPLAESRVPMMMAA